MVEQKIDNRLADTALMVAVCRAIESQRPGSLLTDPYSSIFVRESGVGYWEHLLNNGAGLLTQTGEFERKARAMLGHVVARTRYIDAQISNMVRGQVDQLVLLGAGFDTRAYRMAALADANIYELDLAEVVAFKSSVIDSKAFTGLHRPVLVGADLSKEWSTLLLQAGWDPTRPTIWLAEGLLGYLRAGEQDSLLESVAELSTPGSFAIIEYARTIEPTSVGEDTVDSERLQRFSDTGGELLPDLTDLIYVEERTRPTEFLESRGWITKVDSGSEVYSTWHSEDIEDVRDIALAGQFDTEFILCEK